MLRFIVFFIFGYSTLGIKYDVHRNVAFRKVFLENKYNPIKCAQQFLEYHYLVRQQFNDDPSPFNPRFYQKKHIFLLIKKSSVSNKNIIDTNAQTNDSNTNLKKNGDNLIGYIEAVPITLKSNYSFLSVYSLLFNSLPNHGYVFYSISIMDKYKGKGWARILIDFAVKELVRTNCKGKESFSSLFLQNLPFLGNTLKNTKTNLRLNRKNDFMLLMHLNSEDKYMPISSRMYYTMGFTNTRWCKHSAEDYKNSINLLVHDNDDIYDLVNKKSEGKGEGGYLALFCKASNYVYSDDHKKLALLKEKVDKDFYKKTKEFMKKMDARKRASGVEVDSD
ncbi:hypothetical protein EHP00_355 [Ecytonucleospora hepatopenaei]|uniref:N-acetyltransferase domain-containing protein n=1 Tax=Ecytonucleospora hepatopenaei TaxID=646526 RepID=A0A1W0E9A8_9MICR|nr:hypothetical protein EHP00_355 [Ecytonucleospora hepatopenaei]